MSVSGTSGVRALLGRWAEGLRARQPPRGATLVALGLAIAGLYTLVGVLGLDLAFYQQRATIIWAPSGLAVAAVWLFGERVWWAIALGAFATNLAVAPDVGLSALIALGNTLEALLSLRLVRRLGLADGLAGTRDVLVYFTAVVLLASLVSSLNGVTWLVLLDGLPLERAPMTALIWWLGDMGGVLVVTSLLVANARPAHRREGSLAHGRPPMGLGVAALTAVAAACAALGPGVSGEGGAAVASAASVLCLVLPYPVATWAALKLGMRGASSVTAVVALAAVIGTSAGAGPFQTGDPRIDIVSLWPLLATLSVAAMLLGAAIEERRAAADQRAALEEELRRSRSLGELGLLVGGVAHDFNNLLTVVQANARELSSHLGRSGREELDDIEEATRRGRDLTDHLLSYAGRRVRARASVDLGELVRETARLLSTHRPAGVELTLTLARDVRLECDATQLRQLVMNLVMNAFDAMQGRRGRIVLEVARDGDDVILRVSDDGPGIPPELRARIFEPFFSTKHAGRGIGLAAVLGAAQAHGGKVSVESIERRGTTFTVRLPIGPAPVAADAGPARVLVVDEEPAVGRMAAIILERAGFAVSVAAHDGAAVDAACAERLAAAVLDARQTESGGLVQRLRKTHPELPIVLLGQPPGPQDEGAPMPVVAKPFDADVLVRAVKGAVRAP